MTDRPSITRQIRSVEFMPDAVLITYCTVPEDLRKTGLMVTHQLIIPMDNNEYAEEYDTAYNAVQCLLNDALEDLGNLPPFDPTVADEEDDDEDDDEEDDEGA